MEDGDNACLRIHSQALPSTAQLSSPAVKNPEVFDMSSTAELKTIAAGSQTAGAADSVPLDFCRVANIATS
jgi:hypothetical protein